LTGMVFDLGSDCCSLAGAVFLDGSRSDMGAWDVGEFRPPDCPGGALSRSSAASCAWSETLST
jgi:hypothetical protein